MGKKAEDPEDTLRRALAAARRGRVELSLTNRGARALLGRLEAERQLRDRYAGLWRAYAAVAERLTAVRATLLRYRRDHHAPEKALRELGAVPDGRPTAAPARELAEWYVYLTDPEAPDFGRVAWIDYEALSAGEDAEEAVRRLPEGERLPLPPARAGELLAGYYGVSGRTVRDKLEEERRSARRGHPSAVRALADRPLPPK